MIHLINIHNTLMSRIRIKDTKLVQPLTIYNWSCQHFYEKTFQRLNMYNLFVLWCCLTKLILFELVDIMELLGL